MGNQKGFTLIELVVVIVILGILAAVAVPKFIDLSADARLANAKAVAGSLASASAINYGASLAKGAVNGSSYATATDTAAVDIAGCTDAVANALMQEGAVFDSTATPAADTYSIAQVTAAAGPNIGESYVCSITSNDLASATAQFTLIVAK